MTSIFLARHAVTDAHAQHRVLGRLPGFVLNAEGRAQAERLAEYLAGVPLNLVVSSPVDRARETAEIVVRRHGLDVVLDERFSEVEMGEWTGLAVHEVRERYPEQVAAWLAVVTSAATPGGESLDDVARRMRSGVDALVEAYPDGQVLVVSHKDPIRALICSALNLPLQALRRFDVEMASVSRLDWAISQYFLKYLSLQP